MDVESFLGAQLWLHAVHPDAWPAEGSPSIASSSAATAEAAASNFSGRNNVDGLENVILSGARCCLLLSDDITAPSRRRHRLRFLATNARQPRERADSFRGNPGGVRAMAQRSEGHDRVRSNGRGECPRSEGEGVDSTGEFDFGLAIVQGLVPTSAGDRSGAAAEAGLGGDCGVKEEAPLSRKNGRCPRDSGNDGSSSSSSSSSGNVSGKRGGILLLRIDGRVYQAEHTLIRRIAYPRGGDESFGGGVADSRVDEEEEVPDQTGNRHVEGCSGTAMPREKSPHLRENMGSGCASFQVDPLKDVKDFRSGSSLTVGGRSSSLSKVMVKLAGGDRPKIARGIDAGAGVGGKRRKLGAGGFVGMDAAMRGLEERHGHGASRGERGVDGVNGCAGGRGQSILLHRYEGDVLSSENRDAADVSGRAADDEGRGEKRDCNRRDCHGCDGSDCGGVIVVDSGDELEDDKRGNIGGEDRAEETLFCGLLFPGVFLKFWLPRRLGPYSDRRSGLVTRAKVVKRMQGVVTDMMRGLSSSSRVHPLAYGSAQQGPVAPNQSASEPEARELDLDGLRCRRDAWDEFMYGSHVVLRLERDKIKGEAEDQVEGARSGAHSAVVNASRERIGGLGDDGGKSTGGPPSPRSGEVGEALSPCFGESERRSGLSALAECFSHARVPSGTRSSLQLELQEAEASAERSLENALGRAFPQELSQWTDRECRASKVAELEACLARARSAREGLLHLSLLPTPAMLREANSDAL